MRSNASDHAHKLFIFLALIILLVAAFLRLYELAQYPPRTHYDEAVNLIVARNIAFGGAHYFPILEAYQGREVLYFYLNAPFLTLIHDGMFTFHLMNAFLNLITVAASMALGRMMFRGWRGVVIGLAIGVMMAISFPQIWLARQAFRAVTLPFCQALALLFLWRGLKHQRGYGWLALGGFFAGLALYTYMASRLFPLWLALGGLMLLWADRRRWRVRVRQAGVFFSVFLLTAAPMLLYAAQRPDIFFNRLSEVNVNSGFEAVTLGESILLHLRMFFIAGDPYFRYNISGRAYLTLLEGVLLIVGVGVALIRVFKPYPPTERAGYALALLAPLMVIPSVISLGGLPPSHMRSLGMIPLIFVLVAIGFEAVWRFITRRLPTRNYALVGITLLTLSLGGVSVAGEYFTWAGSAVLYYESDADLTIAGEWAAQHHQAGDLVYVAARDKGHPSFAIANVPNVTWLGTDSLILPPPNHTGLYIFPRSAPPPNDWLPILEAGRISDLPLAPDERTAFEAFRLTNDTALDQLFEGQQPTAHNAHMRFMGMYSAGQAVSGETFELVSAWQVEQTPLVSDLTLLVQVEDAQGFIIARAEPYMADTNRWRVGEVLFQRVSLAIPFGTIPQNYNISAAWVERAADQYLTYQQADQSGGVWAYLGSIEVNKSNYFPDPSAISMDFRVDQEVAEGMRFLGWNRFENVRRPGEFITLISHWYALSDDIIQPDLQFRVLLGQHILSEHQFNDAYDEWQGGALITLRDRYQVPRDQAAGTYPLMLRIGDTEINLGDVTIEGVARLYDAPVSEHQVAYQLGDALELVGYDLAIGEDSTEISLSWYASSIVQTDYTVFVHFIDTEGEIIAQRDIMPVQGTYPTSLWDVGEYVIDTYQFDTNIASVIIIGMYEQGTGKRLQVINSVNGEVGDEIQLFPLVNQ